MASSGQIFEYVDIDYVAVDYATSLHVLVVELVSQDSEVSGQATLQRNSVDAILVTGDASVSGTSKRQINVVNGDLSSDEVGVVTVAGDGERVVVTVVSAVEVSTPSVVSGIADVGRKPGTVVIRPTISNVVSGVAERQIRTSISLEAQTSTASATAERTIVGTGVIVTADANVSSTSEREIRSTVALTTGVSVASGVAERIVEINETTQALQAQTSTVSATAQRTVTGSGTLVVDDQIEVVGVSERVITGSGAVVVDQSKVDGVSEREIRPSVVIRPTISNVVSGTTKRTVTGVDSTPKASPSVVAATTKRSVFGYGYCDTTASLVDGVAEREIETNELDQAVQSSASVASGVAERIINASGSLVNDQSKVVGSSERIISIQGTLETTASSVVGLAEREIETNEIDQAVQSTASTVVGAGGRTINVLDGALTADEVGVVTVAGDGERVVVVVVSAICQDTEVKVDGIAERTIKDTVDTQLESQPSNLSGSAERVITASGALQTTNCVVLCTGEREIEPRIHIQPSPAIVVGTTKRTVTGVDSTPKASPSVISASTILFRKYGKVPLAKYVNVRQKDTRLINVSAKGIYNTTVKEKDTRAINVSAKAVYNITVKQKDTRQIRCSISFDGQE